MNGEAVAFYNHAFISSNLGLRDIVALLVNGAIAFGLNIISFSANKRVGALTMTVAALVKQILTILLSVFLWQLDIGAVNAFGEFSLFLSFSFFRFLFVVRRVPVAYCGCIFTGIVLTLVGGALYAYVGVGPARREGGGGGDSGVEDGKRMEEGKGER